MNAGGGLSIILPTFSSRKQDLEFFGGETALNYDSFLYLRWILELFGRHHGSDFLVDSWRVLICITEWTPGKLGKKVSL